MLLSFRSPVRPRSCAALSFLTLLFSLSAFGQSTVCSATAIPVLIHQEGLAERVGDLVLTCAGGVSGRTVSPDLFVSLNTNITNRLDLNGLPQGLTVTINSTSAGNATLTSASTLSLSGLSYSVPSVPSNPVTITISGLRAAVASLPRGSAPALVTATVQGIGAQFTPAQPVALGVSFPTLLQSTLSNGVPCAGSGLPSSLDFASFTVASSSSTVRATEASLSSFATRKAGDDTGTRLLVNLSGYGAGTRVFLPDMIVGNDGFAPTSPGAFGVGASGGTYNPGGGQLLLMRVQGANSSGAGGSSPVAPAAASNFNGVSELTLNGGAGVAVYEVVDSNPNLIESVQIPVFVVVPSTNCPSTLNPSLTVQLAPLSTVSIATATDPVPRFVSVTPASDCKQLNDCGASYLPSLTIDTTPVKLSGSAGGNPQSAFIRVGNGGAGMLNFTTSIAYQSASGWLSVSPTTGVNNVTLQVSADPASLQPGTYNATVMVNAGSFGSASLPVTFTVGAAGVVINNVGNAASFFFGSVAPGSYAVLYGSSLAGRNVSVTFNGLPADIVYNGASQINLIVPGGLSGQLGAAVIATVDGKISNTFRVSLAPNNPGIFTPGVVNVDDSSVNSADHPVARGSFISVYLTGLALPLTGQVTVRIGNQSSLIPSFAGAQPTLPALQQVNVVVPATLQSTPNPAPLQVCVGIPGGQVCSNLVNLYIR